MEYNKEKVEEYVIKNGLNDKCRRRDLVDRRSYLYKYMRSVGKETFDNIGKLFNTHHSTVIHAINKYEMNKGYVDYVVNCSDLIINFPIIGDVRDVKKTLSKNNKVLLDLSSEEYLALQSYRIDNMIYSNENALKHMISKSILF